jgi:hypothetical protein
VTKSGISGTTGWAGLKAPMALIAAVGVINTLINASSLLMEARRDGDVLPVQVPFFLEFSSLAVILGLAPLIARAVRLVPLRKEGLPRALLIHAALTVPFSLAHVGLMVVIRELGYRLAGARYGFFDEGLVLPLVYEWRKDVVTYAILGAIFWYFDRRRAEQAPAPPARIELRDGGAAFYLEPADIHYVSSAGNYVEFHTTHKTHLIRGVLTAWEKQLAPLGFARIHRSRLVNRERIASCRPTASGDMEVVLDDGRKLVGSRRYRAALSGLGRAPGAAAN